MKTSEGDDGFVVSRCVATALALLVTLYAECVFAQAVPLKGGLGPGKFSPGAAPTAQEIAGLEAKNQELRELIQRIDQKFLDLERMRANIENIVKNKNSLVLCAAVKSVTKDIASLTNAAPKDAREKLATFTKVRAQILDEIKSHGVPCPKD